MGRLTPPIKTDRYVFIVRTGFGRDVPDTRLPLLTIVTVFLIRMASGFLAE